MKDSLVLISFIFLACLGGVIGSLSVHAVRYLVETVREEIEDYNTCIARAEHEKVCAVLRDDAALSEGHEEEYMYYCGGWGDIYSLTANKIDKAFNAKEHQ